MKSIIGCREAVRQLWRFLDEELEQADQERVEEHLEYCVHCCGELEFARELRDRLSLQQAAEVPPDVRDRLEAFVDGLDDATA